MPRGHIVTDPSTFSYFVILSLEYPNAPRLIWILVQWQCLLLAFPFLEAIRYPKSTDIAHVMVEFWK